MDKTVAEFFKTEIPSYAAYDNIRKCASYIDGFKISMRKLYYSGLKYCDKDFLKTETFSNYSAAYTNYLHGSGNLSGVAVSMVQNFVGANNYPLFVGNSGGWGSRIVPRASAPRYTKLKLSEWAHKFFNDIDQEVVGNQVFEGDKIEPKFFVPILPLIFINGSDGLSTGFSQKILPRNPKAILTYIKKRLAGKNAKFDSLPWFKDFKGQIKPVSEGKLEIYGKIRKESSTKYVIEELPVYVEYASYVETLDRLVDSKVIVDYVDKCDTKTNTICIEVKTTREFSKTYETEDALLKVLKLVKPFTEIFNCVDENNRIREFKSAQEIIDAFIDLRLKYYQDRKDYLIKKNYDILTKAYSKYVFCVGVVKGEIVVNNRSKDNIVKQLEKFDKIKKIDGSYDYILSMPVYSLSKEMLEKLKKQVQELKEEIKRIKDTSKEQFWQNDLETLKFN